MKNENKGTTISDQKSLQLPITKAKQDKSTVGNQEEKEESGTAGTELLGPAPPTPFVFVKPGGEAISPMSSPQP